MKPPAFRYARPGSIDEALRLLGDNASDAKLLAGGQSLVPALNFRLAAPALLIDINGLPGMDHIEVIEGGLRLGALVRWHQVETSAVVAAANPLLQEAVRHVAHYQIRNRGTLGGSCAHADPAAELPAVLIVCDGELVLRNRHDERVLRAASFFRGTLDTALAPDELLTELRFPPWPARRLWAFEEFARRKGDFAIVGVAVLVDVDRAGICVEARLVVFGASDLAGRLRGAESVLRGRPLGSDAIENAAAVAAREVEARSDMHAPADYRRALTRLLIARSLRRAAGIDETEAA